MRKVQERGNELATVLISTYLRNLHWCTTHLGTKIQLFYERAKGRCIFHYCRVKFEIGLSSICDIMSFPIPSFAPFLCSSAKVVHQPLKVERSGGKPFRSESSSCGEYSARKPFPFQCFLNLASLVQDFAAEHIIWQCAIASIFVQCPSAHFKHICHLLVA